MAGTADHVVGGDASGAQATPKVAVVVLNWNDADATLHCLDALAGSNYRNHSVIVVDNASADGSAQRVAAAAPDADLIINDANLGFAGGVNVGVQRAMETGADYVWLLNSDALTAPDVLGRLVDAAEADKQVGLVSPVFHDPDDPARVEFCLARFDPVSRTAIQTTDPVVAHAWQAGSADVVVLLGTALLVRRALIEAIGVLDPQFFAYVEDVDYALRCHAAGFKAIAVADAVVLHKFKQPVEAPESVPPYLHYFMTRNYLLLWRKLAGSRWLRKASLWFLRQRLLQIARMPGQEAAIEAVLAGIWDGVRGVGGPYRPERRAPGWLRATLGRHPGWFLALLDRGSPSRSGKPRAGTH